MKIRIAVLCLTTLLLASCGKQDVHSACYSNGDHEHMSDGRIIRICDCLSNAVQKGKPTEQEAQWIVAWLNHKSPETKTPEEIKRADGLIASLVSVKTRCEATK